MNSLDRFEMFERWAQDKPALLAICAHSYTLRARPTFNLIMRIRNEDLFLDGLSQPDLDSWLLMFRNHSSGLDFIQNFSEDPTGFMDSFLNAVEDSDDTNTNTFVEDMHNNFKAQNDKDLFQEYLKFQRMSDEEFAAVNSKGEIEANVLSPDFYFFARILAPCWLLYETTPAQLLRKARLRDFDSLLKLIKLDSSTIFDRRISRYVHDLRNTNRAKFEQIQEAFLKGLMDKISLQSIKISIAAIITLMSIEFGHRLKEPDVRELFDAVACDAGDGDIDTDLPESPHAFYVGMKRRFPKNTEEA